MTFPSTVNRQPSTAWAALAIVLAACQASTNRPPYDALPAAALAEVELGMPAATETLAEALRADSVPVVKVEARDGFLDSGWFDATSLAPTGRLPVGPDVVRVRAWATPTKVGFVELSVETVYRPIADPSRPERDLDVVVPPDHPVQRRVNGVLQRLLEQYGDTAAARAFQPLRPPAARPDTGRRDTTGAKRDTTTRRRDTALFLRSRS
ncbi:MAG: hypothetical protein ACRENB_01380 [Gemmatimonadales bacterium]